MFPLAATQDNWWKDTFAPASVLAIGSLTALSVWNYIQIQELKNKPACTHNCSEIAPHNPRTGSDKTMRLTKLEKQQEAIQEAQNNQIRFAEKKPKQVNLEPIRNQISELQTKVARLETTVNTSKSDHSNLTTRFDNLLYVLYNFAFPYLFKKVEIAAQPQLKRKDSKKDLNKAETTDPLIPDPAFKDKDNIFATFAVYNGIDYAKGSAYTPTTQALSYVKICMIQAQQEMNSKIK